MLRFTPKKIQAVLKLARLMPGLFFIIIILQPFFAEAHLHSSLQIPGDTIITKEKIDTSNKVENKVIDEVIESKKPVKKVVKKALIN